MPNVQTVVTSESEKYKKRWIGLCKFLGRWFYRPDYEALRIALSVYVAHHYLNENPVWMYIIGPPGSGKTSIVLKALEFLPNSYPVTDLTTNSFLSGFGDGKDGLLYSMAKSKGKSTHGVITFPDFTGFLQKNENVRDEVMGQMRQLWDGKLVKQVGNIKGGIKWTGKVTCIAAVTPAIERFHKLNGELGERFISVRWPNQDPMTVATKAMQQVGHEAQIRDEFYKRVNHFVNHNELNYIDLPIDPATNHALLSSAVLLAKSRCPIERDRYGRHPITNVPEHEAATRIIKAVTQIAKANACMARRQEISEADLKLTKRVILDSIPRVRRRIIDWVPLHGDIRWSELIHLSQLNPGTFIRVMEDMKALGIVTGFRDKTNDLEMLYADDNDDELDSNEYKVVRFTEGFRKLIIDSGVQTLSMVDSVPV